MSLRHLKASLLTAGLLLALTACSVSGPAAPTPEVTPPAPALEEPPVMDWMAGQPVPDFLDETQQQLFLHAFSAANFLMGCETTNIESYPRLDGTIPDLSQEDWAEYVELDGWNYLISVGRYRQWDDFQEMLDSLFTPEYQQDLLTSAAGDGTVIPLFRPTEDGLLAYMDLSRGSALEYNWYGTPDSYELVSQTGDEIVFNLIGHYSTLEEAEDGMLVPSEEYTTAFPIRMERTEAGWRFAEFHLPY